MNMDMRPIIAIVVTIVWATIILASIFTPIQTPLAIHALMATVVGYYFGRDYFHKLLNGRKENGNGS